MKEGLYLRNKKEVFKECGLKPKDRKHNTHHCIEKNDVKRHLVPQDFPINERFNLIPLPIQVHNELHELMDNHPYFRKNMETRVYLANMAFCGELDLVPDRLYFTYPIEMRKR